MENTNKLWLIVSRLDHPVYIDYGGENMTIPPRGKMRISNKNLVGALPKGVSVVPFTK